MLIFVLLLTLSNGLDLTRDRNALLSVLRNSGMPLGEMRLRRGLLRGAERLVRFHNANPGKLYSMALNKFSLMTQQEKSLHLGIENGTLSVALPAPPSLTDPASAAPTGNEMIVDHRALGHVTPVIEQGGCGSCWAVSSAAAFEGSYAIATGILKSFSSKELLDCTYEGGWRDGCSGGHPNSAFKYIKRKGRLGTARDIPYDPYDGPCSRWKDKENGIKNAIFVGHYSSKDLEKTLNSFTPVTIFTVQDDLFKYSEGIYTGCAKKTSPNHGAIMTGYSANFWEVKNSWGTDWGNNGFFRVSRVGDVCGVTSRIIYPAVVYQDRGEKDQADTEEEDETKLRNAAAGHLTKLSDGKRVTWATDGDVDTCFSVGPTRNPSVVVSMGESVPVSRVEIIVKGTAEGLKGSKVHIGNRGDFLDRRVAVLDAPTDYHDLHSYFTIKVDPPMKGSRLFWEIYGEGSLAACEIRALTTTKKDDGSGGCPSGLTRCLDGTCRHKHMC